jgi:zinc transporter ZupT
LTLHRIPSGITLGILLTSKDISFGVVIAFIVHIIPEILIVFYRQTSMGVSK